MNTSQPISTRLTMSHMTTVVTPDGSTEQMEQLAIETPYSIALNDETIGSSMVLPIGLEEFGAGFLFGQGYIKEPGEIKEIYICPEGRIAVYADVLRHGTKRSDHHLRVRGNRQDFAGNARRSL